VLALRIRASKNDEGEVIAYREPLKITIQRRYFWVHTHTGVVNLSTEDCGQGGIEIELAGTRIMSAKPLTSL